MMRYQGKMIAAIVTMIFAPQLAMANGLENNLSRVAFFASEKLPSRWLPCDGKNYNAKRFKALYEVLGTKFGTDAGQADDNFNVPDIRGRVIANVDGPLSGSLAQKKGTTTVDFESLPAGNRPRTEGLAGGPPIKVSQNSGKESVTSFNHNHETVAGIIPIVQPTIVLTCGIKACAKPIKKDAGGTNPRCPN